MLLLPRGEGEAGELHRANDASRAVGVEAGYNPTSSNYHVSTTIL
jgi:hypothetical protein